MHDTAPARGTSATVLRSATGVVRALGLVQRHGARTARSSEHHGATLLERPHGIAGRATKHKDNGVEHLR